MLLKIQQLLAPVDDLAHDNEVVGDKAAMDLVEEIRAVDDLAIDPVVIKNHVNVEMAEDFVVSVDR